MSSDIEKYSIHMEHFLTAQRHLPHFGKSSQIENRQGVMVVKFNVLQINEGVFAE